MKRTERIDREREVALPMIGRDVFTTVGDLTLNEDEKRELSHNLALNSRTSAVVKIADAIEENAQAFFLKTFTEVAPQWVLEHVGCEEDAGPIYAWMEKEGFRWFIDGLTTVVMIGDKVLGTMPAKVEDRFAKDVIENLKLRKYFRSGGASELPQGPA